MEKEAKTVPHGLKRLELMKSFRLAVRSLLTAFPSEDLSRAFPNFSKAEQDRLNQLYIQIITALHENMQEKFDYLCQETQVGTVLDTVEDLVEQQSLDPLFSQKTNMKSVKQDLLAAKKNEILLLQELLDKVEDEKHSIKARIKLLKKTHEDTSMTTDAAKKLSSMIENYSSYNGRR